jgi:hypothetical protein
VIDFWKKPVCFIPIPLQLVMNISMIMRQDFTPGSRSQEFAIGERMVERSW